MKPMCQILQVLLDGEWDFFYSPQYFDALNDALPAPEKFTGKMVTPGYWDDFPELYSEEDFFGLTARFNPDYRPVFFPMARSLTPHAASSFLIGTGFYRKTLEIGEFSQAVLTVGPAMWGCSVFCNGSPAGVQTGYSTGTEFDLSALLKANSTNEIIIAVCNRHDDGGAYCRLDGTHAGMDFGTRPGQHRGLAAQGFQSERGGIGGGVSLKFTGKSRIKDYFISFENEVPHWHIELVNGKGCTLEYKLGAECAGKISCANDLLDFTTPEFSGKRWSEYDPCLYDVELTLYENDNIADKISCRWGAVKSTVEGKRIFINGIPAFFRGVTEHCYFAETTNPHFDYGKYVRELGVLKAAGFNFIRCHTWCPPEPFFDACDTLGIYVQTELPSVYTFAEAEAVLKMLRRHVCAVIFCEGNEKMLDEAVISRVEKLCAMAKELIPGILFMPQEANRGVDCHLTDPAIQPLLKDEPFPYYPARLEKLDSFCDVYSPHLLGYCSYGHDLFPGVEKAEEFLAVYNRPVLLHEVGIMGGYLDFDLEKRYENTFIGTAIFKAARDNMKRHGVWENHKKYYQLNAQMVSGLRKQLLENIRSCPGVAGFDYLGGIDTHWHLNGYPCGVFNEFYEEKFGESIADVATYNAETILMVKDGKFRNLSAGKSFDKEILISHFGRKALADAVLSWQAVKDGKSIAAGEESLALIAAGTVGKIARLTFALPDDGEAYRFTLKITLSAEDETVENSWDFFAYPAVEGVENQAVRKLTKLDAADVEYLTDGGKVLLTAGFPGEIFTEAYRPHTSGRSIGHSGTVLHNHPVWERFPHKDFAEWNFFPLMTDSTSLTTDKDMPEYTPILELIPSFKLIRRKSLLSEYQVGKGRLFICGLRLDVDDPAAKWLEKVIIDYLASGVYADAPSWEKGKLLKRITEPEKRANAGMKIDSGGRPIEE